MSDWVRLPFEIPYDQDFLGEGVRVPLPKLKAGALRDSWENGRVLDYIHYSLVMNAARRLATYTAVNVDGEHRVRITRGNTRWVSDPRIPEEFQTLQAEGYAGSAFDKGHLVRREDVLHGTRAVARAANDATFVFPNAAPQHMNFNQDEWLELEDWVLDRATDLSPRLCVFSGPVFGDDDPAYGDLSKKVMTRVSDDYVIPVAFWKVVTFVSEGADGVGLSTAAFLVSQDDKWGEHGGRKFRWLKEYQVSVRDIERLTGLDFGAQVRRASVIDESALDRASTDPVLVTDREQILLPARGTIVGWTPSVEPTPASAKGGCGCGGRSDDGALDARVSKLEQDLQTVLSLVAARWNAPTVVGGSRVAAPSPERGVPWGGGGERSGEAALGDAEPAALSAGQRRIVDALKEDRAAQERVTRVFSYQSMDMTRRDARSVVDRIMGGTDATADEFPDCALIRYDSRMICTGVLVAPQVVLTAAHCAKRPPRAVRLRATGEWDANARDVPVISAVYHPEYRSGSVPDADIMVLFLAAPVDVSPVRVATVEELAAAQTGMAVGFGSDRETGSGGAGVKRKAELPIGPVSLVGWDRLTTLLGERFGYNPAREFLAGIKGSGVDTCSGDSGGPLYVRVGDAWCVAGLTSRAAISQGGRVCGDGGIYTLVDPFRAWIREMAARLRIKYEP